MAECDPACCDGNFGKSACEEKTTRVLEGCIPLPLPDEIISEIVPKAKDYALLHGAGMRFKDTYNPDILQMAPFFLLPSAFPRREFDRVVKLQPLINILMHRIAHDHEFLESALKNTIRVDDFTAKLWEIYLTVREEGVSQFLEKVKDTPAREAYILMDKIRPPMQHNYLVRGGTEVKLSEVVSELGIFGVLIGNEKEIMINKFAGHMLRTKLSSANEGGVAAGFGALDSVFLFD
ncbi:glutathione synthetase [Penaeus vannamei]|uniref:Glutathione synthetase n=1 Tax=Penaeus vannamei TaxID=6689 RepID=A0A423TBF6_PENVA|nr:glutathione synthetase [Penaeus vannamei]